MTMLYLYDDARARSFEPFASTRPVSEMRAGIALIRDRWKLALQPRDGMRFLGGARQASFDELDSSRAADGVIPAGSIIANARFAPGLPVDFSHIAQRVATCTMWRADNQLVAVRIKEPVDTAAFADGSLMLDALYAGTGAIGELHGWWLNDVWDFVRLLPEQLTSDIPLAAAQGSMVRPTPGLVVGDAPVHVEQGAVVEPHVVLDATGGPIMIRAGSHVRAFSRITGPCFIGRDVTILAGDITCCSIGDLSKVRGEINATVLLGHSNKSHEGFVGHSYVGRWVNLGAGTTTSNLKNTYGSITLWTPDGVRDTGMQFLGTLFGDHVKTGIGLRLTTGTVLGAGANVYGGMPPKVVAPFSWGKEPPYSVYRCDKFLETAARMMGRRHVELTDRARRHLTAVHSGRWIVESDDT